MDQPVYLHEFQRPTLDQIISEGCKAINEAVEKVISKYEAPQITPNPYFVGYLDHAFKGEFMYRMAQLQAYHRRGMSTNDLNNLCGEYLKLSFPSLQQKAVNDITEGRLYR